MRTLANRLAIEQIDRKVGRFTGLPADAPSEGWIRAIRGAIGMSLRQLGKRLGVSAQNVRSMEQREALGTITIGSLRSSAQAMDMELVYAFIPRHGSIRSTIDAHAARVARELVERVQQSMLLEADEATPELIEREIAERAERIAAELPRYLWE